MVISENSRPPGNLRKLMKKNCRMMMTSQGNNKLGMYQDITSTVSAVKVDKGGDITQVSHMKGSSDLTVLTPLLPHVWENHMKSPWLLKHHSPAKFLPNHEANLSGMKGNVYLGWLQGPFPDNEGHISHNTRPRSCRRVRFDTPMLPLQSENVGEHESRIETLPPPKSELPLVPRVPVVSVKSSKPKTCSTEANPAPEEAKANENPAVCGTTKGIVGDNKNGRANLSVTFKLDTGSTTDEGNDTSFTENKDLKLENGSGSCLTKHKKSNGHALGSVTMKPLKQMNSKDTNDLLGSDACRSKLAVDTSSSTNSLRPKSEQSKRAAKSQTLVRNDNSTNEIAPDVITHAETKLSSESSLASSLKRLKTEQFKQTINSPAHNKKAVKDTLKKSKEIPIKMDTELETSDVDKKSSDENLVEISSENKTSLVLPKALERLLSPKAIGGRIMVPQEKKRVWGYGGSKGMSKAEEEASIAILEEKTSFRTEQLQDFARLFRIACAGSHGLQFVAFRDVLEKILISSAHFLIPQLKRLFDHDRNGDIEFVELIYGLDRLVKGGLEDHLVFTFQLFDWEGDGLLSRNEVLRVHRATWGEDDSSPGHGRKEFMGMYDIADVSGDGNIDLEEFLLAVNGNLKFREHFEIMRDRLINPTITIADALRYCGLPKPKKNTLQTK